MKKIFYLKPNNISTYLLLFVTKILLMSAAFVLESFVKAYGVKNT